VLTVAVEGVEGLVQQRLGGLELGEADLGEGADGEGVAGRQGVQVAGGEVVGLLGEALGLGGAVEQAECPTRGRQGRRRLPVLALFQEVDRQALGRLKRGLVLPRVDQVVNIVQQARKDTTSRGGGPQRPPGGASGEP
jgi:hypothetical protein